jgi:hypothetical protein
MFLKVQRWWYELSGHFDSEQYWEDEVVIQNRVTEYFNNKFNNGYGEPKVYNIEFACSDNSCADIPKDKDEYIHSIKEGEEDEA